MKICQITPYWKAKGGITTVVKNLTSNLLAMNNEVYVITPDLDENSDNLIKLRSNFIKRNIDIFNHLRTIKPDIIHVHAHGTLLPGALLYKRFFDKSVKIACTFHTKPVVKNSIEASSNKDRSKLRNKFVNYMVNKLDYNVFVSKDLITSYKEHMGIKPSNSYVIYNGVNEIDIKQEQIQEYKDKLEIKQDQFVISMVSTLQWDLKVVGVGKLIKAFDKFNNNIEKNSKLFIAGDGQYRYYLENILKEVNNDNIILLGNIDYVDQLLALSDIYAHTSPLEGCCMAILEAMAMGKYVLAVEGGGNGELIKNNYNGVLVDFDEEEIFNGLTYLYKSDNKDELASNALKDSKEKYSWNVITKEYLDLYLGKGASHANKK